MEAAEAAEQAAAEEATAVGDEELVEIADELEEPAEPTEADGPNDELDASADSAVELPDEER
jgi:hypothetical protein